MKSPPTLAPFRSTLHSAVFTTCSMPILVARGAVIRRQGALVKLELLERDIQHIQETVFMQQNYARATGFTEPMPPDSLVEVAA